MSQPTIIAVGTNTKAYTANADSGTEREFTIAIPANANTMIVVMGLDNDESVRTINSLALTGVTGAEEVMEIDMSPSNAPYRISRAAIFDLTGAGAATGTLTATISSSSTNKALLGVVCTDGFVESFSVTQDRQFQDGKIVTHSSNMANNTMVYMMVSDLNTANIAYASPASELFDVQTSDNGLSVTAASQATTSNNTKTIAFSGVTGGADGTDLTLLLSSQSDPFDGITGKLTSPIIK
tara:strand:- start:755 stop:1471 length:717 start_codon:yes stop_codon:yes gene_type:complete